MSASQFTFILHALAPALAPDDTRPWAVVRAMERGLSGLRLAWMVTAEGIIPAPEGDARTILPTPDGGFDLYCNESDAHPVTITGMEIPAGLSPGGKPRLDVYAKWPVDAAGQAAAANVLEGVAEAAVSSWGHVTPDNVTQAIWEQISHTSAGPTKSPRGLPMLKQSLTFSSPDIPGHLGWLNYWSAAAARAIGFPDPARDAELLSRSRRTATGGWVVQLTDELLDLDNPAHLGELLRAYERFPVIGGRAAPLRG